MLRKFVPVLGLLAVPAIAAAQFEAGDFEFTLTGQGSATRGFQGQAFGVEAGLGYFVTRELSVGVRQGVSYLRLDQRVPGIDRSYWGGSTYGYADYHFDMGAWQPYVGGFVGVAYPEGVSGSSVAGPEAGVKYFVNATTFVFGNLQYAYLLSEPSDSYWAAQLGVGFRF
jgi:hypothetical protein